MFRSELLPPTPISNMSKENSSIFAGRVISSSDARLAKARVPIETGAASSFSAAAKVIFLSVDESPEDADSGANAPSRTSFTLAGTTISVSPLARAKTFAVKISVPSGMV